MWTDGPGDALTLQDGASWNAALEGLRRAPPRLVEAGGSHARDLSAQVHLDALASSGRLAGAHDLLQPLVRAQPASKRLERQAARLYAALGLGDAASSLRWS